MIHSLVIPAILAFVPPATADDEFFETKIRPVLAKSCVRCHGPEKASGGLRVDSREGVSRGGEQGPLGAAEHPEDGLLVKAILRVDDEVAAMPPDRPLGAEAVADLRRWVGAGMPWPDRASSIPAAWHWAFEPVRAVNPPGLAAHPIDGFLEADRRSKGLVAVGPADKRTLIRRATYDLLGLPPTPEEVEAFVRDDSPRAFETVVDRLLASPRHGEKWGRAWLDVAHYADTAGETADFPVPDAWRYRNYVIDSINADKPYDQFVREQIAGDILAEELPDDAPAGRFAELVTATGYLAIARRFGFDSSKDHHLTLDDTIDTVGKGVLGLTIACARCHDHKYDPISAEDYYALYGIFASTRYPSPGCEKDRVPRDNVPLMAPAEQARRLGVLKQNLAEAERALASADPGLDPPLAATAEAEVGRDKARLALETFQAAIPTGYAVAEGRPHDARIQIKGEPETLGAEVPRRFLRVLGGRAIANPSTSGRRNLAAWIADPGNSLTARVIVNRVWQGHFGEGLVRTPDNFGVRGEPPTHPELLDWLAARFVAGGWSLKKLHRLIMLSDAYRQAVADDERNARIDPDNLARWRFDRRRLTAEEIRDALLAASGDLDLSPGGPHPFPDPKTWGYTQHNPFTAVYDHDRRSIYLMTQRIKRHPFLALFDGPDPNSCTGRRDSTVVPTQALYFLNDPFVHARAEGLARRLAGLPDDPARLDRATRLLFGRPPREIETALLRRFMAASGADARTSPANPRLPAWAGWLRVLFASNEFCYVN